MDSSVGLTKYYVLLTYCMIPVALKMVHVTPIDRYNSFEVLLVN